jgi:hypothetical protein
MPTIVYTLACETDRGGAVDAACASWWGGTTR